MRKPMPLPGPTVITITRGITQEMISMLPESLDKDYILRVESEYYGANRV